MPKTSVQSFTQRECMHDLILCETVLTTYSKAWGLLPPLPPLNPYPQRLKTRTPYEGTGFEGVGVRVEF
jgi:hypothetical protein